MFRPMRRKAKEISIEETKYVLQNARYGVLAVNGDDGYPYAIPVNYYYDKENSKIYFHSSRAGHKVDSLNASDKICFTVCGEEVVKEEDWAPFVKSAVVFGRCRAVEDQEEAIKLVKRFAMKYYPDERLADDEIAQSGKAVRMYEITIEHMSGKEIQEK